MGSGVEKNNQIFMVQIFLMFIQISLMILLRNIEFVVTILLQIIYNLFAAIYYLVIAEQSDEKGKQYLVLFFLFFILFVTSCSIAINRSF